MVTAAVAAVGPVAKAGFVVVAIAATVAGIVSLAMLQEQAVVDVLMLQPVAD